MRAISRTGSKTTVVLADDHPIMRQGLAVLLASERDFAVIGQAEDGRTALDQIEKIVPDILVADIQMPGLGGIELVRQLSKRVPQTKAILFSMYETDTYVLEALRAGAWGYLIKGADASELIHAIRVVVSGKRYLCAALPKRLHEAWAAAAGVGAAAAGVGAAGRSKGTAGAGVGDSDGSSPAVPDPYDTLSARERDVFQLVAEGKTNQEIGERLFISTRTVEIHRANALRKLDLRTGAGLFRYAVSKGLVSAE